MTLDQAVQKYRGTDAVLHIGSSSGFYFIGTAEEYEREINALSVSWKKYFKDAATDCDNLVYNATSYVSVVPGVTTPEDLVQMLKEKEHQVSVLAERQKAYHTRVDTFIPFRRRTVAEEYQRMEPDTMAIITTGDEMGPFWDARDWAKAPRHYPVREITKRAKPKDR